VCEDQARAGHGAMVVDALLLVYHLCTSSKQVITLLTAKEKGEKKLFGFSFVPLMQEDGRTLPDGTHELIVHKVPVVPIDDRDQEQGIVTGCTSSSFRKGKKMTKNSTLSNKVRDQAWQYNL
jgi:hypothetical protein